MKNDSYLKNIFYILVFLGVIITGVLFKVLSSFFIPVVVAILLSCVFYPIVKTLNRRLKIPWFLGTIIMVLAVMVVLALLSTIIGASLTAFFNQYAKYEAKFLIIYHKLSDSFNMTFDKIAEKLNIVSKNDKSFSENMLEMLRVGDFVKNMAFSFSGNVIIFMRTLGIVLLLMFFLLLEMRFSREKVNSIFKEKHNGRVMGITRTIISDTVNFLSIKSFISFFTGILVFLCCLALKIDFAILWGFVAFIMNFIPTFGSIFSVLMTTLFALLQYYPNHPLRIVLVFVIMTAINFILGNIIEPRVEGKKLGLSPFVILVSLMFWGWMWGFVGMVIAVPLMVCIKIVCENIDFLRPIAVSLGNCDVESPALSNDSTSVKN